MLKLGLKTNMFCIFLCLIMVLNIICVQAQAADKIAIAVNESRVLVFNDITKIAVANPEIADVVMASGVEVIIVGKAPGTTSLHVWSQTGRLSYTVQVIQNDNLAAEEIKAAIGYAGITVKKLGKTIVLEGTVCDQHEKTRAEKLALTFGDKVINLLEINKPVKIKIEAKLVEIDKQKAQQLGIKWGNGAGGGFVDGLFQFGQSFNNTLVGMPLGNLGGYSDINAQLETYIKNGSAKILSQPNITTLSGEKANIMIGGQIPVPVSIQGNQIGIEWKEYGIKLDIEPEVNNQGLISSKIKAEVSSLDWNSTHKIQLGNNMFIPPLRMRKAETVIALSSGQMFAIGGLIANETSKDITKLPFLGDIPILGNLFKSTSFSKNETELIIMITPTIVE